MHAPAQHKVLTRGGPRYRSDKATLLHRYAGCCPERNGEVGIQFNPSGVSGSPIKPATMAA